MTLDEWCKLANEYVDCTENNEVEGLDDLYEKSIEHKDDPEHDLFYEFLIEAGKAKEKFIAELRQLVKGVIK